MFPCPFFIEKRNGRKISIAIIEFKNVSRIYQSGDHELKALDNVSMKLDEGKFVVTHGRLSDTSRCCGTLQSRNYELY